MWQQEEGRAEDLRVASRYWLEHRLWCHLLRCRDMGQRGFLRLDWEHRRWN